jgi:RNA-directed DNA polymerase
MNREPLPGPAESKTLSMRGHPAHENRESPEVPVDSQPTGRSGKACGRKPDANATGQSDIGVVPMRASNKAGPRPAAEMKEGRPMTKENPERPTATRTQSRGEAMSGLDRIRKAARGDKTLRLNNLMHHVTVDLLRESYHALKHDAAAGVDGVTWNQYGEGLEARLADLHERAQSGRYRPKPSKRTYIPKADGRQRPIGIAALEDKVLQRAVSQVLGAIWEEDFANFSYGFRPGRSQHNALDALWVGITQRRVNWVLDADIRSFFDTLDHGWLMKFVEHRVADSRMQDLIRRWLRAGVSEDGQWTSTSLGTPQGAVISPLLANLYLHYVLDLWVKRWRSHEARGEAIIVRYADDFVMGFQYKDDAERCLAELRERFAQFGLELHQEKTRLIEFGRFAIENRERRGTGRPETFNFLGFTHICARRRKDGKFTVWRRTIAKRMRAKLREIKEELMRQRHTPVPEQGRWLRAVVRGYFNYHAVPDNIRAMNIFRGLVNRFWHRALRRRSQKGKYLSWERMQRLIQTWIPPAKLLHPYPNQRLRVSYPR